MCTTVRPASVICAACRTGCILRRRIVAGEIVAGTPLRQEDLARRFDVSCLTSALMGPFKAIC